MVTLALLVHDTLSMLLRWNRECGVVLMVHINLVCFCDTVRLLVGLVQLDLVISPHGLVDLVQI